MKEKKVRGTLPDTQGWGPPRARRSDHRALQLTELSILRRMAQGQSRNEIGAALGMHPDSVTRAKSALRKVFGVDSDEALLAHPDVRSQI